MQKRLYRSRTDRKLGGVCAGLGQHFAIDPVWIRLAFILLAFADGIGLLLYLLLWILVPSEGREGATPAETIQEGAEEMAEQARHVAEDFKHLGGRQGDVPKILGIGLIILGLILTVRSLGFLWLGWLNFGTLWPLLLIALGVMAIFPLSIGGGHGPKPQRGGSLVGGAILITLGVVFLLNNFGLVGWAGWESLLRLWPILLIAIGLDALIGRRSVAGGLVALAVVMSLTFGALWLMGVGPGSSPGGREAISYQVGTAERAEVTLKVGVGKLRVDSHDDPDELVRGTLWLARGERVDQEYAIRGGTAYLELGQEHVMELVPLSTRSGHHWELLLSERLPTELNVDTGVGEAVLDLSQIRVTDLDLDTGIGQTTVTLPARGRVRARIDRGIGEVVVIIPREMEALVRVEQGLGSVHVLGDFDRGSRSYVTDGFRDAEDRVELDISGGIGVVTVRREE